MLKTAFPAVMTPAKRHPCPTTYSRIALAELCLSMDPQEDGESVNSESLLMNDIEVSHPAGEVTIFLSAFFIHTSIITTEITRS